VFGGASPIFGIDTKTKSEDEVAWLDDASMKVGERSKSNLMSPPCDFNRSRGAPCSALVDSISRRATPKV